MFFGLVASKNWDCPGKIGTLGRPGGLLIFKLLQKVGFPQANRKFLLA